MQKFPLKVKLLVFAIMMIFMFAYTVLFGPNNAVIGIMIVMAALMNLANDMSYKPKLSFLRILILLLALGIVAFLNNTITIWGCILTFLAVFATTFTSYHLFGMSVYLPYLMCYFMMMCVPVTLEELPMRLLALFIGAAFIVGFNRAVNRNKEYKLTHATITTLSSEIKNAIDLKLKGENVSGENFKVANNFYLSIFSKFDYKYFPSKSQESVLNIVKAFQYIGSILSKFDLTVEELNYLKGSMDDLENIEFSDIFANADVKTKEMNLILLNLEIIVSELKNKDFKDDSLLPDKRTIKELLMPIVKRHFSFKSPKFTFAFKMAFVLTLWEVLTLVFNLPYTKWLYFASIPLMLPYVNDVAESARSRLGGTIIGVSLFALIIIAMPYIPISAKTLVMILMVVCILGMLLKMEDKLQMTVFTTVMSVMVSLMYITPPEAITLKILWVAVAIGVVSLINFTFLPYSVEKETSNNLKASGVLNEKSIELIKDKCRGKDTGSKTTLMVVNNIIRENIEVSDENRQLYQVQGQITDISNFILTALDVHDFSKDLKGKIIEIIDNDVSIGENHDIYEKVMLYSVNYMMGLFKREKELAGQ